MQIKTFHKICITIIYIILALIVYPIVKTSNYWTSIKTIELTIVYCTGFLLWFFFYEINDWFDKNFPINKK